MGLARVRMRACVAGPDLALVARLNTPVTLEKGTSRGVGSLPLGVSVRAPS